MKYFDKHDDEIRPGMKIVCLIDSSTEHVYKAENGDLGIMGNPLEDLLEDFPLAVLPLYLFANEKNEIGYTLYQFEIVHR